MAKTTEALLARRDSLVKQLERVQREILQSQFVDKLVPGAYVYGKLQDGTEYSHARLLGKTEASGTAGEWYKLRLNEDTAEETVKSVRLSNIDGVEGDEAPAPEEESKAEPKASKKKDPLEEI